MEKSRFHIEAVKMLRAAADPHFQHPTMEEFVEQHRDAVAMIIGVSKVNEELLQVAPKLKIIARFGVGYDNVDVEACTRRDIYVTITPDPLSGAVADLTLSLMLCLSRRILEADRYTRKEWAKSERALPFGADLSGKNLGIVGLGRIGFQVAKRAKGFGMNLLYADLVRKEDAERQLGAKRLPVEELLREADFVTIHVPLTEKNRGLIGRGELSLMKKTAFLINTSRGAVVDQEALTEFLKEKRIAGAGLDVFRLEPIPLHDPLLELDNVVLTPHAGSATVETRRRMAIATAEEVLRVLKGDRPVNVVPEQIGKIF